MFLLSELSAELKRLREAGGVYNMGIDRMEPHRQYNGIFHLERSPKMHPLQWPACR